MPPRLEEPDSGYAWVIALSACMVNTILSGMARMIGFLYVAIIDEYGVSRNEASVPFMVRNAVRYLTGPVVGVLGQRYSIRSVTFVGGFIAALGSVLCCNAPNVTCISVFWGLIHGLGFSMSNTLFHVSINQYFVKHKATAFGVVLSGACACSFVFPFAMEAALDSYGLFGCFLLMGGFFLNVCPAALFMKPPPWVSDPEGYAKRRELLKGLPLTVADPQTSSKTYTSSGENGTKCSCLQNDVPEQESESSCTQQEDKSELSFQLPRGTRLSKEHEKSLFDEGQKVVCTSYCASNPLCGDGIQTSKGIKGDSNPSVYHISGARRETSDSEPNQNKKPAPFPKKENSETLIQIIKNIGLLYKIPMYWLINLNMVSYFWIFLPVQTVIIDYGRDKNVPPKLQLYLVHSLTIGDLIGRVSFGWVTDRKLVSLSKFVALSFILQGLFVALFPFATAFWSYMAAMCLYGVSAGVVYVYISVLITTYVDQENQAVAVGCVGLLSGLATFGIPSVIGYFRDNVGSYDGLFYIISVMSIITGGFWFLEPLFLRVQNSNKVSSASA